MIEAAGHRILHLDEPIQLPLHLVEEVRLAVPALGDVELPVSKRQGECSVCVQQIDDDSRGKGRVLAVIARVVPALRHVMNHATRSELRRHVTGMAEPAREAFGVGLDDRDSLPLVVVIPRGAAKQRLVGRPANVKRRRVVHSRRIHVHVVLARSTEAGEVGFQHLLAGHALVVIGYECQLPFVGREIVGGPANLERGSHIGGQHLAPPGNQGVFLGQGKIPDLVDLDGGEAVLRVR